MSEILSNIVVEQTSINFSPDNNNINITPEAIQLNVFTGAAPGAGQSSNGELLYNNVNLIDGVPNTSYANGNLSLGNVANISIGGIFVELVNPNMIGWFQKRSPVNTFKLQIRKRFLNVETITVVQKDHYVGLKFRTLSDTDKQFISKYILDKMNQQWKT